MWPEFICGRHHKIFAQKLEEVANGTCKRLIVNMPPRHTKSTFALRILLLGIWVNNLIVK